MTGSSKRGADGRLIVWRGLRGTIGKPGFVDLHVSEPDRCKADQRGRGGVTMAMYWEERVLGLQGEEEDRLGRRGGFAESVNIIEGPTKKKTSLGGAELAGLVKNAGWRGTRRRPKPCPYYFFFLGRSRQETPCKRWPGVVLVEIFHLFFSLLQRRWKLWEGATALSGGFFGGGMVDGGVCGAVLRGCASGIAILAAVLVGGDWRLSVFAGSTPMSNRHNRGGTGCRCMLFYIFYLPVSAPFCLSPRVASVIALNRPLLPNTWGNEKKKATCGTGGGGPSKALMKSNDHWRK